MKFISTKIGWVKARDNCILLGWKLFSGLDGTVNQAKFLFQRSGNEPSWSGIFKNEQEQFVTVDGERVTNKVFRWRPGNPGEQMINTLFSDGVGFTNKWTSNVANWDQLRHEVKTITSKSPKTSPHKTNQNFSCQHSLKEKHKLSEL